MSANVFAVYNGWRRVKVLLFGGQKMKNRYIKQWVADFLETKPIRANSLIITIYGDAIAPHGGTVWLGSFIRLVESLGLNQRMVRTGVFRLSKEKWLVAEQIGRRSYYSLTPIGRRRFEHAYRRVYVATENTWNGEWQIVFTSLGGLTPAQRENLRRELLWEGFGSLAPGILGQPKVDAETLQELLHDNDAYDKVVVMRASSVGAFNGKPLQELVRECWNLDALSQHYKQFLERFRPVLRAMRTTQNLDPEQCFLVRTLLMHEFRRVLLRDPQLPEQLLPQAWPGAAARQLCVDLYRITHKLTEQHLMNVLETANGPLPEAAPYFYERFGGLGEPAEKIDRSFA